MWNRKKRGGRVPLQALAHDAAAGSFYLDAEARRVLAAFRALSEQQQKEIVVGVLQSGGESIGAEDIPGGVPEATDVTASSGSVTDEPPAYEPGDGDD